MFLEINSGTEVRAVHENISVVNLLGSDLWCGFLVVHMQFSDVSPRAAHFRTHTHTRVCIIFP